MKKVLCFFFAVIIFITTATSALAISNMKNFKFSIREGIEWGMSKEEVIKRVKRETKASEYEYDYHENIAVGTPFEGAVWGLSIRGINLGKVDETVSLFFGGTWKHGLYDLVYTIILDNDDLYHERLETIIAQLEKKYEVKFSKDFDMWNTRPNNLNNNGNVSDYSAKLADGTWILIRITPDNTGYKMVIEYQSKDCPEIEASILDGSYFIEAPYGL